MASTFSPSLRIELIGDGDQSGIWGQTTNNNLGTLLEQAIAGVVTITMLDTNYTLSNFNGVSDESRNQVIIATGTNSAQRDIIAPLVEKTYIVRNNTTGGNAIRIIGVTGTGVTIPNGITASVYCDGTNFFSALSGTVGNFTVNGNLVTTGTANITGLLTGTTATFSGAISSVSPAFTGTPTAPTASPGTSTTQIATTAFTTAAVTAATGSLGTMSTQNANNVSITGGTISGLGTPLPVASGGSGRSTLTTNNVILGNGTSAVNFVAPGTSGNLLVSNGTTWNSTTLASSGVKLGLGITGEVWNNVTGSRATGQTYTNNNAYPIMISMYGSGAGASSTQIFVNGSLVYSNNAQWNGAGAIPGGTLIIPPGATYSVNLASGLVAWWELY